MKLPAYEDYKDSGILWLGEVPVHWELAKLKNLAGFSGGGTPSRDVLEYWNGSIPWVSPKDMKAEHIERSEEKITAAGLESSASRLVGPGRVLIVVRSGILKHTIPVAINSISVALNQDMKALTFEDGVCSASFFMRWVQGLNGSLLLAWAKQGATVESIEHSYVADTVVPLPPREEQAAIVAFLDGEIAKVDTLVAEHEKLIALLAEKRQATISHAVTKGLDPHAASKGSSVPWLGEVPMHWEVRTIASISTKITNGYVGPTRDILESEGVRYLQSLHIKNNNIRFDSPYYVRREWSEDHSKSILEAGDVLIVQTGDIGQVAVVTDEFAGCNCHALIIVAPDRSVVLGPWLSWVLNSDYGFHSLLSIQTGALHPHLNCGNVKALSVPIPPIVEQRAIADFIEEEVGRLDRLIEASEQTVSLLRERRSAVIAAAVTGQIDVRGEASDVAK